ncbi:MAG: COX15/CtaA family protein [Planctomycetota bacterium]
MSIAPSSQRSAALVVGVATALAMWGIGFVCRVPPAIVPGPVLLSLMIACLLAGGFTMARLTGSGWRGGAASGLVTSLVNLLVVASLLSNPEGAPNEVVPSALWWVPGSLAAGAITGAIGEALGSRRGIAAARTVDWTAWLTRVDAVAAFMLLGIGGLVTSAQAGLAVPDWPNSFGTNMFLFPLAKMVGGAFYEHSHRLFGSLVGLITLALSIRLLLVEAPRWLRVAGFVTLGLVVLQGVLGGLRVTGRFTLASSVEAMSPSIALAVVHGILGQCVFGAIVALVGFTSATWRVRPALAVVPSASTDRFLSGLLVGLVIVQLVLGALVRHLDAALMLHLTGAVFVVVLALANGLRAWGLHASVPMLRKTGLALLIVVGVQMVLGLAALFISQSTRGVTPRPAADVILTTTHQSTGALILALAVGLLLWTWRLLEDGRGSKAA